MRRSLLSGSVLQASNMGRFDVNERFVLVAIRFTIKPHDRLRTVGFIDINGIGR